MGSLLSTGCSPPLNKNKSIAYHDSWPAHLRISLDIIKTLSDNNNNKNKPTFKGAGRSMQPNSPKYSNPQDISQVNIVHNIQHVHKTDSKGLQRMQKVTKGK